MPHAVGLAVQGRPVVGVSSEGEHVLPGCYGVEYVAGPGADRFQVRRGERPVRYRCRRYLVEPSDDRQNGVKLSLGDRGHRLGTTVPDPVFAIDGSAGGKPDVAALLSRLAEQDLADRLTDEAACLHLLFGGVPGRKPPAPVP